MTLRDIISQKPVHYADAGSKIYDVVCLMSENNVGAVPVLSKDGRLLGIFSERDLLNRCAAKKIDMENTVIDEVMSKNVILMEAHDSYNDCLKIMKRENIRHMPVRDGDKLVGVVSIRDLIQIEEEELKQEIENLNSYIYYYK